MKFMEINSEIKPSMTSLARDANERRRGKYKNSKEVRKQKKEPPKIKPEVADAIVALSGITLDGRDAWVAEAICSQVDPEIFFPRQGEKPDAAKSVCAQCPVRLGCLDDALRNGEDDGVRGGLTSNERKALRKLQQQ